jgi:hypothetical protein
VRQSSISSLFHISLMLHIYACVHHLPGQFVLFVSDASAINCLMPYIRFCAGIGVPVVVKGAGGSLVFPPCCIYH